MNFIQKNHSPAPFEVWKQSPLDDDGRLPTWENLHGKRKREVMGELLKEQGWVCCYCGGRIGVKKGDSHIEHLRPRSKYPDLRLAYGNLLASCQGKEPPEPNHCGHRKRDWFDEALTLSPLDERCEGAFCFLEDGRVKATKGHARVGAAKETLARLNLNSGGLQRQRQAALEVAMGLDLDQPLSTAEINQLLRSYDTRDSRGMYTPFRDAIAQCLSRLLPKTPPKNPETPLIDHP